MSQQVSLEPMSRQGFPCRDRVVQRRTPVRAIGARCAQHRARQPCVRARNKDFLLRPSALGCDRRRLVVTENICCDSRPSAIVATENLGRDRA